MTSSLKKTILFTSVFLLAFSILHSQIQYEITFLNEQLSGHPEIVKIVNIDSDIPDVILNGRDTLILDLTSSLKNQIDIFKNIDIFPNPFLNNTKVRFHNPKMGIVLISIYDISGRKIISKNKELTTGEYTFQVSGLETGIFLINIQNSSFQSSELVFSQSESPKNPEIKWLKKQERQNSKSLKSAKIDTIVHYNQGDRLKITATLGLRSVSYDNFIPTENTILSFDFIPETANNLYPSRIYKLDTLELAELNAETLFSIDDYGLFKSDSYYFPGNTVLSETEAINVAINTLVQNSMFSNVFDPLDLNLDFVYMYSDKYWTVIFKNQIYSGLEVQNSRIIMIVEDSVLDIDGHHFKDIFIPSTGLLSIEEIRVGLVDKVLEYYGLFEIQEFVITEESILEQFEQKIYWFEKDNFKEFRLICEIPIAMGESIYEDHCDFYVFVDALTGELLNYYPTFICK